MEGRKEGRIIGFVSTYNSKHETENEGILDPNSQFPATTTTTPWALIESRSTSNQNNNNNNKEEFIPKAASDSMDGIFGGCFPWSWLVDSVLWKHLCPKGLFFQKRRALDTTTLPKELVLEILCRLPLTSVIRFRLVCKQWCLLTSTQSFIDMHEKNQPTTPLESAFVVQYFDRKKTVPRFQLKTFFINEKATKRNKKFQMVREYIDLTQARDPEQYYLIDLLSSYKGFLLFTAKSRWPDEPESALIFYNPVTKEQVTVTAPPSSYVYWGFFFHSPTKEYRILYQVFDYDHKGVTARFELLGLQTRSLRKIYVNKRFSAKYYPDLSTPAVISNGALHWMVSEDLYKKNFGGAVPSCSETILYFGMESEEFCLMPHPRFHGGRHDCISLRRASGHKMNLLEMDGGILCLCDGYLSFKLNIFVMENYETWAWVRKHVVPLYAYPDFSLREYGLLVKAMQIHQGELLLNYHPNKFTEEYLLYPLNQDAMEEVPDGASYKFIKWLSIGSNNLEEHLECFDDDNLILKKKKKKKKKKEKSRFKVAIDQIILKKNEYLDDDQTLRRMIISHPGTLPWSISNEYLVPSASVGNIVVLTPSIASLQLHQSTITGNGSGCGNYILSVHLENHFSDLREYDVQTRQWRRVSVPSSSFSSSSQ